MKQFFKFFFASFLGCVLTLILSLIIFLGIVGSLSQQQPIVVAENSILHITLDKRITDRTSKSPAAFFDITNLKDRQRLGLNDILKNIHKAVNDENIKGILLDISTPRAGIATLEEIRNALIEFKKSGKFIFAYSEMYSQGGYYLATIADKIYLNCHAYRLTISREK